MLSEATEADWKYDAVPPAAVRLFRMAWQLETWLRLFVHVELRAGFVDWEAATRQCVQPWPPVSLERDKRLHHMATPHQAGFSFLTFGQLWDIIKHAAHWPLFSPYFPPRANTEVRIDEIKAIRNRVAHFREPHPNDVDRMSLFMRDMEAGVRRFCNRYCVETYLPESESDPVADRLAESWDAIGYGIELHRPDNGWLYAPHPRRTEPLAHASLERLTHENYRAGSAVGTIYRLVISAPTRNQFDLVGFFESTRSLHTNILHLIIQSWTEGVTVTVPAIIGTEQVVNIMSLFLAAGVNCADGAGYRRIDAIMPTLAEYVIRPDHMLSFYSENIAEPILEFE